MLFMKKILVTGAAGFIGFHLVKALCEKGVCVVGIDNINDYYDVDLKYDRLSELGIDRKRIVSEGEILLSSKFSIFKFSKIDITDLLKLETLFSEEKFDCVAHFAAQAGVRHSLENPHAYVQSNLVGFVNLLECCRYNNIKHFVYASSSSVYGANNKIPFSEEDRVDHPLSLYAATKRSNELMAYTYNHLYNLQTTGLRFFTVYGPWGRPDMAPMLFADAITRKEAIKVFNNGDMQRDFTYIDDVIKGVIKSIYTVNEKKPGAEIFNLGNSKPIDLIKFIEELERALGSKAIKKFYPMQNGDVKRTFADTSKLSKTTNYKPNTDLSKGIHIFSKWFKTYKKC